MAIKKYADKKKTKTYYQVLVTNVHVPDFKVSCGTNNAAADKLVKLLTEVDTARFNNVSVAKEVIQELAELFIRFPKWKQRLLDVGFYNVDESKKTVKELFIWSQESSTNVKAKAKSVYFNDWKHFLAFGKGDVSIEDITVGDIKEFEKFLLSEQKLPRLDKYGDIVRCSKTGEILTRSRKALAKSTIGGILNHLGKPFNQAVEKGWIDKSPVVFDRSKYPRQKPKDKAYIQNKVLNAGYYNQIRSFIKCEEFGLFFDLVRYQAVRCGELLILRWEDVNFDTQTMNIRGKDTSEGGGDSANKTVRYDVPIWPEVFDSLKSWHSKEVEAAIAEGRAIKKFIFNGIFDLEGKPEFSITREGELEIETLVEGRYETSSAPNTRVRKLIKRHGLTLYPQAVHAWRDVRINEFRRMGITEEAISAWVGNSYATRAKHYGATAVTQQDVQLALANAQAAYNASESQMAEQPCVMENEPHRAAEELGEDIGNDEGAAGNTAGSTSSELVFGTPAEVFGKLSETELTGMILNKLVHAATNAGNPANTAINEVSELVQYIRRVSNQSAKQGENVTSNQVSEDSRKMAVSHD
jgi:integrase